MSYKAALRVWRGDAGAGALADYQVEVNEGEVVLDVLHRLQATPGLATWPSGGTARRASGVVLDGDQRPAAAGLHDSDVGLRAGRDADHHADADLPGDQVPVTYVSFNYAKAREIPSFTPPPSVKPGEFRMQQVDVNRSQEFRKCIECFLCQTPAT